ncbi:DUF4174 domain-containing protein [Larkinella rosea]|uniref:DUF4174 domain-containing protein n=2 Tax=Larkinella rosea TaxID=2025312 RepID=A0A3P1B9H2_9BACT|nr:DUF4174 domain-containing protein [Larkinella rosea]
MLVGMIWLENAGFQSPSLKNTLAAKRDHRRVLVIYSRESSQQELDAQQKAFQAEKTGLAERDLDVIVLTDAKLPETDRRFLMQNPFNLSPATGFKGWLIGKDGGVKHAFTKPVDSGELFRIIDSMPMRQAEMSKGKKS